MAIAAGQQWFNPTLDNASITAEYGQKPKDPNTTWRAFGMHSGIDYGVKENSAAYAIGNGKIVRTGFDNGIGNYVTLETSPGHQVTYQHLNKSSVKEGQTVAGGFQIGFTGNTGSTSEGAHLHTEYKINDQLVSPNSYYGKDTPAWVKQASGAPNVLGKAFNYSSKTPSTMSSSTQFSGVGTTTPKSSGASFVPSSTSANSIKNIF